MIELFSANTPNGKKISIMLEEIGYEYKTIKVDLDKGEQFKPEFKKISPLSKIPVIIDQNKNKTIFESGAILMYLADESGKFYDQENRLEINTVAYGSDGLCWTNVRSTPSISLLQYREKVKFRYTKDQVGFCRFL